MISIWLGASFAHAQSDNPEVIYPVGRVKRSVFEIPRHAEFFNPTYDAYQPDAGVINLLKKYRKKLTFRIVMGFWCDDSRLHVPHFLKILETAGIPEDQIRIYGVDENKQASFEGFNALRIVNVPTFIVYLEKTEIGRIVETPTGASLDADLSAILLKLKE